VARLKRNMTVKEVLQDHEERHEIAEDFIERHRQWGGPQLYIPNVMLLNRDGINLELWNHNAYIRWCNNVDMWNDREDAGEMYMFRWNDATYWVNSLRTIVEGSESIYPEAEMILQVMDDDGLNVPTITWHTNMNTWDNVGDGSYSLVRTAAGGGAEIMFYIDKDDIVFNEAGRDTDFRIETDTEVNALFLNSGTGYLGLRTGTPAAFLHIYTDDVITDAAMLRIEQGGVGDANLEWYLGPGARFIMGIDNDDGNRWKLAMSSDLGTSTRLVVDTGGDLGIRCNPLANMHLHDPTTFCYFYITTGNRLTDVGIFWGDQYAGTDFYMGIDADDSRLHIGAGGAIGTNSAIQIDNTGALTMVVTNLTMVDGGWIGQAAGPLLTFDDTNNFLEITGCKVGIDVVDPLGKVHIQSGVAGAITPLTSSDELVIENSHDAGIHIYTPDARFPQITFGCASLDAMIQFFGFFNAGSPKFGLIVNGTEILTILDNDNVGINIPLPLTNFHIYEDNADTVPAVRIEQDGAGDAALNFLLTGGQNWSIGIDNSVTDTFMISGGADLQTNPFVTVLVDGSVGIGTTTVPHGGIGAAKFALDGTIGSVAAGPHIQVTTTEDDYPVFQLLSWAHDEQTISWDAYFDGAWRSSHAGSNFVIAKGFGTANALQIKYDSGIAQGAVVTWNDGITLLTSGFVGINIVVPLATLDVVGTTRLGDSTTNYLSVEADGTLEMNGTAMVFNDLQFAISNAKVPASNAPTWETFTANTNEYGFAVDDYIDTQANETPHSWKLGEPGHVHMHITTKAANSTGANRFAKFTVLVAYVDTGEVWQESSFTAELTIPDGTAALTQFYLDMGDLTLTTYIEEAELRCRITRIAATGGVEYAGNIFITQVGIHLEEDTIGTRTELNK